MIAFILFVAGIVIGMADVPTLEQQITNMCIAFVLMLASVAVGGCKWNELKTR